VFGKIDTLVCNAASNPYYGPQAGISDDQFFANSGHNIVANHWLISLVVPQMIERKEGSITSSPRSAASRLHRARRLCDFQSRRHAARAESRLRIRQAQYPRELHRAGPDQDRLREALWENPENA